MHNQNQTKQRRAGLVRSHGIKVRKFRAAAFGEASAAALVGLVLMLVAFPVACSVDPASAADSGSASTTVTYDFAPTIDISLSKANVDFNISANEFNKLKTDSLNVTVSTNNVTGYTLNMTTDSSATNGATITTDDGSGSTTTQENVATNALVNTSNNKFYIPSITSSITNPTDSTFPVNSWAYSINAVDNSGTPSTSDIVYNPLPAAGSSAEIKKVTELDFPTDGSEATADDVTPVTVATKTDMSVPAGTYTNKLVFTALTNFNGEYDEYHIVYNANGGEGDMSMISQSGFDSGDAITLYSPNYWRTGHGFLGWSTDKDAESKIGTANAATIWGPNESITIDDYILNKSTNSGEITLYAVWKASEGNLQNWNGCLNMSIGDVTALTDTRDGDTYAVGKFADNKCWVMENFRLHTTEVLTSDNTNNPTAGFALTENATDWCASHSSSCNDQIKLSTDLINPKIEASPTLSTGSWYSYGVYYNWHTATAGHGLYSTTSGTTSGSICPAGWHLPSIGNFYEEYNILSKSIGGNGGNQINTNAVNYFMKYPNNFLFSGINGGQGVVSGRMTNVNYWTSTAYYNGNTRNALRLWLQSDGTIKTWTNENVSWKFYRYPIRCASDTPYTITYDRNGEAGDGESTGADGTTTVGGDMSMVTHTNIAPGNSIMLYAPNYWRKGYGFLGWSTIPDAAKYISSAQAADNGIIASDTTTAIIYGPSETITVPDNGDSTTLTLYAIWKKSAGNMQSWDGCSSMNIGDVTALTDVRDNNTYAVAKLADGKCWQTENMRLSSGTIDATNTNNPIDNFAWTANANNWCNSNSDACANKVSISTSNINTSLKASPTDDMHSSYWYSYGVYYNWYAVTAGRGTRSVTAGVAAGDLCPLGWHLPTSGPDGNFITLYTSVGNAVNLRKFPTNYVLSGFKRADYTRQHGLYGDTWASTAYNTSGAYTMTYSALGASPQNQYIKYGGQTMRCVAK